MAVDGAEKALRRPRGGLLSHPFVAAPHPHAVAGGQAILHNASRVGHRALTIRSRARGARGSRRPTRAAILDKGFDGARSREESTHVRNNTRRAPDGSLRNTAGAARTPRHDPPRGGKGFQSRADRKSTRLNSSHLVISYAVFCLKKKTITHIDPSKKSSRTKQPRNLHRSSFATSLLHTPLSRNTYYYSLSPLTCTALTPTSSRLI